MPERDADVVLPILGGDAMIWWPKNPATDATWIAWQESEVTITVAIRGDAGRTFARAFRGALDARADA